VTERETAWELGSASVSVKAWEKETAWGLRTTR